jgi:hypothetical protein
MPATRWAIYWSPEAFGETRPLHQGLCCRPTNTSREIKNSQGQESIHNSAGGGCMNPCKVCRLDPEHRTAIDEALRNSVPLDQISLGCGIGRSSLHRHRRRHLSGDRTQPTLNNSNAVSIPEPQQLSPSSSRNPRELPNVEPQAERPTKQQLLERIETLWSEGLEGLAVSKEKIDLTRADGSKSPQKFHHRTQRNREISE